MLKRWILLSLLVFVYAGSAFAISQSGITYQGRILRPDGSPLNGANVQFRLQIRTPNSSDCLMYEELKALDMRNSNGIFGLTINDGNGSRTDSTALGLDRIFGNYGNFTFDPATCASGSSYTPSVEDGRRLTVLFKDETMSTWEPIPAQTINYVPYAIQASQLAGFAPTSILRVQDAGGAMGNFSPLSNAQYTELLALVNGTSTRFSQLNGVSVPAMSTGEVLGWNGSAWVSQSVVGGANSVTSAMIQANAVDSTKLANGAVGTSQIASNVSIATSGTLASAITTTRDFKIFAASPSTFYVGMAAPALASSYTLTWPMTAGGSGQVLTTDGSGALTWTTPAGTGISALTGDVTASGTGSVAATVAAVGGSTAAQVHSAELAANAATSAATASTIVKRDGSGGFSAGAVTQTSSVYKDSALNTITVQAPTTVSSSYVLKWPTAAGSAAQVLTTDALGNLSWTSPLSSSSAFVQGGNTFGAGAVLGTNDNFDLRLSANGATAMTVATDGKIGIGTTAPNGILHISVPDQGWPAAHGGFYLQDLGSSAGYIQMTDGTGSAGQFEPTIEAKPSGGTRSFILRGKLTGSGDVGTSPIVQIDATAAGATVVNRPLFAVSNAGVSKVTVDAAGSVGIGTTSPAYKLDVAGDLNITGAFRINGTPISTGLTNFTESVHTAAPNATVPVVRLLATNAATNVDVALSPKGTGSVLAQVPNSAVAGGNKRGANAVDLQTSRSAATAVASGSYAVVSGGTNNTASGIISTVIGGQNGVASGFGSTAGGNASVASAANALAIGEQNTASGNGDSAVGGQFNVASGGLSFVAGGNGNTASGFSSFAANSATTASAFAQSTFGRFNLPVGTENAGSWVPTDPLFVVGNGTGTGASRSNALMILKNGYVGIGTTAPSTKLEVVGSLRVGDGGETCDATRTGAIRYNGGNLQFCAGTMPWTTLGTAGSGLTALTGDVTATGPGSAVATVAAVGGVTAANVATGANLANAATNSNTASTIVKRDASGNFAAGAITQTSSIFKDSGANTATIQAPTTITSSYILKLPTAAASSNQVLQSDSSGNTSWVSMPTALPPNGAAGGDLSGTYPNPTVATVGAVTAANVASGANLANAATALNTSNAIVKRDGTGNFAANVGTFNGVALNNAGSIVNLVNPVGAGYTLTLPTGTGSSGQVLTTDGTGILSWAAASAATQWTTQAPGINYMGGNVGIGTTSAVSKLQVKETLTNASGNQATTVSTTTFTPAAGSTAGINGTQSNVEYTAATNSTSAVIAGVEGTALNSWTGRIGVARGVSGYVGAVNGGTIDNGMAGFFQVIPTASTITNAYGVYTGTVNGTNKWSFYASDAAAPNYFAGNVGIGTSAPGYRLDVYAAATESASVTASNFKTQVTPTASAAGKTYLGASFNANGSGTQNVGSLVGSSSNVINSGTTTADSLVAASATAFTNTTATTTIPEMIGSKSSVQAFSGFNTAITEVDAFKGSYESWTNGTTTSAYGGNFLVKVPMGQVTNAYGVYGEVKGGATGTITNGYGVYAAITPNGGPITNRYGVYITDAGSGNNYYNIYSQGAGKNYFGGSVGIGTTSPSYKLDVVGDINVTGNFKINGTNIASGTGDFKADGSVPMTGQLLGLYGTNNNPGFGFNGDPDTGMYRSGANKLAFATAGNTAVTIDNAGLVGIGTTSPTANIHVASTTASVSETFEFPSAQYGGFDFVSGGQNRWSFAANGPTFGTAAEQNAFYIYQIKNKAGSNVNSYRFYIGDNGNVGVGTSAPNGKLDVKGAVVMSGSTSGYTGFQPAANAGSTVWTLPTTDGSSGQLLSTNGSGVLTWASASAASQWTTQAPGINYMGGSVGIGTTSPATLFDVVGSALVETKVASTSTTAGARANYIVNEAAGTNATSLQVGVVQSPARTAYFNAYHDTQMMFSTQNTPRLTIANGTDGGGIKMGSYANAAGLPPAGGLIVSGSVGIGTSSPAGVFDVRGGTAASETSGTSINIYAQNAGSTSTFKHGGNINLMPGLRTGYGTPGRVGIGTTVPQGTLHVKGVPSSLTNFAVYPLKLENTTGDSMVAVMGDDSNYDYNGFFYNINGGTEDFYVGTIGTDKFQIRSGVTLDGLTLLRANGNVGIGTSVPTSKLEVNGTVVTTPNVGTGATVDLAKSNLHVLSSVGGTSITLNNMVNGGNYTIVVKDTTSRQYTFANCTTSKFLPANAPTTVGTWSMYTILALDNGGGGLDCMITWATGYQ